MDREGDQFHCVAYTGLKCHREGKKTFISFLYFTLYTRVLYTCIVKAIVTSGNKGYAIKIIKVLEYPPRQQFYIEVKEKLKKKSNYTLNLRWYSKLNPEPEGFYVDQYESPNGIER